MSHKELFSGFNEMMDGYYPQVRKAMPYRWGDPVLRTPEPTESWVWELLKKQAELNEALSRELEELKAAVARNRGTE